MLREAARLECMPTAGAAQYRNFADRWSRGYATKAGTLGDGGQAKRGRHNLVQEHRTCAEGTKAGSFGVKLQQI